MDCEIYGLSETFEFQQFNNRILKEHFSSSLESIIHTKYYLKGVEHQLKSLYNLYSSCLKFQTIENQCNNRKINQNEIRASVENNG